MRSVQGRPSARQGKLAVSFIGGSLLFAFSKSPLSPASNTSTSRLRADSGEVCSAAMPAPGRCDDVR